MMQPQLPPEITDRIIDYLWDDVSALYCCSLVARFWVACSRFHLFSTLRIWDHRAFNCLVRLIQDAPHMLPYFGLVRELRVYELQRKKKPYSHSIPHIFAVRLPQLRILRFWSSDWKEVPFHPSFSLLLSQFSSVTRFELDSCVFSSLRDFQRVICAFPQLSHLFLRGDPSFALPKVPGNAVAAPIRHNYGRKLRLLSLGLWLRFHSHEEHTALWEWLLTTPSSHSLESICVNCPGTEWDPAFAGVLRSLGPSLLRLETPLLSDDEECTLAANFNLRELVINNRRVQSWPQAWKSFTRILDHITSQQLQRLTFNLLVCVDPEIPTMLGADDAQNTDLWKDVDWKSLNEIISSSAFSSLKNVHIRLQWELWGTPYRGSSEFDDFRRAIARETEHLHWHKLGILRTSHGISVAEVYDFDFKQYDETDLSA